MVWRVTPAFSSWISSPDNIILRSLSRDTECTAVNTVELGSGISGLVALSLGPRIAKYIATDQLYVLKLLNQNIVDNRKAESSPSSVKPRAKQKSGESATSSSTGQHGTIETVTLDWELDSVLTLRPYLDKVDLVIACDCIYNEALVRPFVDTCAEVCRQFQPRTTKPSVCIVAQQLRSPDVFETWLKEFWKAFRVWRVPDELLNDDLRGGSGLVVHMGILRESQYTVQI